MNRRCRQLLAGAVMLLLMMAVMSHAAVYASDDNSLASLGIQTEGAVVSPEFRYDVWEYNVEVPAGTTALALEPHTTNPSATVNSVTGTTLNPDGTGTVVITVTSESGNAIEYVLHVTSARAEVDPAEAIAANESAAAVTIDTEVVQSERETEDPRYVKVDRNSLEDAENTIEKLQKTIMEQRSHISMLTYVLYVLIAVSIIFLFIVISQLLRRRDMAQELAYYRQENPGSGSKVADDGWGDWGEDDAGRSASSWTNQQVGTPVRPQYHPARPAGDPLRGSGDRKKGPISGAPDETRRYQAVQPVRAQNVPKDVTKDLSRVNKAEAKAMKKAAAAEAKRMQEDRRAARAREEEAFRQAQEAQRIRKEQENARRAQEEALERAARQEDALRGQGAAADGDDKNVKINLIDL